MLAVYAYKGSREVQYYTLPIGIPKVSHKEHYRDKEGALVTCKVPIDTWRQVVVGVKLTAVELSLIVLTKVILIILMMLALFSVIVHAKTPGEKLRLLSFL